MGTAQGTRRAVHPRPADHERRNHWLRTHRCVLRDEPGFSELVREQEGWRCERTDSGHLRFSGRETARLFHSCGSKIYALTRNGQPTPESGYIIHGTGDPSGGLPEQYFATSSRSSTLSFFSACDVVVNTLPDSEHTRGFIGEEELEAMKGDAIYVNIGRGTTTNQEALVKALQAKPKDGEEEGATGTLRIGGASLECVYPPRLMHP